VTGDAGTKHLRAGIAVVGRERIVDARDRRERSMNVTTTSCVIDGGDLVAENVRIGLVGENPFLDDGLIVLVQALGCESVLI
jgi:hypothetical protein